MGHRGRDRMVGGTTDTISTYHHYSFTLDFQRGEEYSIQLYVINVSCCMSFFSRVLRFPSRIKAIATYDLTGILLKEALTNCKKKIFEAEV
jgi:hypothetical protein